VLDIFCNFRQKVGSNQYKKLSRNEDKLDTGTAIANKCIFRLNRVSVCGCHNSI